MNFAFWIIFQNALFLKIIDFARNRQDFNSRAIAKGTQLKLALFGVNEDCFSSFKFC